ncbi:carbohydrate ABC transporter permease [Serinicoccus kebangsaanensis]|uniref:carbohydrate ABC transporter permease n=1 Tax=Serinicoccus kebangsaanensis TaxID=2602069 RepID=UPI00124CE9B2|nr:carbohydrate ABC transporter permease [Serinicoccus kebangsaanensis]
MKRDRSQWWHLVLAPLAVLWMVPVIMVLGQSLRPVSQPGTILFGILPAAPNLSNYALVFEQNPILTHLRNSLLITVPSVLLVVMLGSMTAFALARMRVPFKAVVFGFIVLGLVLPMSGIVVAVFQILQTMGLYNSLVGIVLSYSALGLPFAVIIVRTTYLAVPHETFEAARVDGASWWQIFWRIYFPLGRPALAVVVIWQTMLSWNDFLLPLVVLESTNLVPLTLVPLSYRGVFLSQPGALFAILVLISVPVVLTFVVCQRYLVNGLAGAVK